MIRLLQGDCRDVLRTLPDESVHCVITSPPYWGLRDYNISPSVWGGDPICNHTWGSRIQAANRGHPGDKSTLIGTQTAQISKAATEQGQFCQNCGAWRGTHGLEPTIDLYIKNAVEVFQEVKRVLRNDGALWLNLGDAYNSQNGLHRGQKYMDGGKPRIMEYPDRSGSNLKPKDLCGIPWRVAFALQDDGWYLRQDIIWAKPNPMPESVTDRCTKAHEYIFLLSKNDKYFYDAEAIKEKAVIGLSERYGDGGGTHIARLATINGGPSATHIGSSGVRNKRSVWTIATAPFSKAHFATFPPALVTNCIKAGTSERGCCSKCGAPLKRLTETDYKKHKNWFADKQDARHSRGKAGTSYNEPIATRTTGWEPTCKCDASTTPCTVLDPFGGAGTTALVATGLGRNAICIELNPDYVKMAHQRMPLLFADISTT